MLAGGGKIILGSDSHTRYGALGTMAMGEGGPELVKQLLSQTYDINMPGVVAVYLEGEPVKGVGPQDVALAIIGAELNPGEVAYYDGCIKVDLSKIRPMIAMPFHPSNIGGWANIANEYATKRYRSNQK